MSSKNIIITKTNIVIVEKRIINNILMIHTVKWISIQYTTLNIIY